MIKIDNPARCRLENGELALGVGVRSARGVEIAMAMKTSGYDFLFIDLEHGAMSLDVATQISTAALGVGIAPLVRVPEGAHAMASRALDGQLGDPAMTFRRLVEGRADDLGVHRALPVGHLFGTFVDQ